MNATKKNVKTIEEEIIETAKKVLRLIENKENTELDNTLKPRTQIKK